MGKKDEEFLKALDGKHISPLTLDNKWHRLFDDGGMPEEISKLAEELNGILQKQGNINNELKKVKGLKKKLLDEMVTLADDAASGDSNAEKELAQHKKLIEDCNKHIDEYQDELLDYPRDIDKVNKQLMLLTMDDCYYRLIENGKQIESISKWIDEFRIELKKQVVRKQDKEIANHRLYSYMHDIFGTEVIDIFDMKYVPNEVKMTKQDDQNKKQE